LTDFGSSVTPPLENGGPFVDLRPKSPAATSDAKP